MLVPPVMGLSDGTYRDCNLDGARPRVFIEWSASARLWSLGFQLGSAERRSQFHLLLFGSLVADL